MTSLYTESGPGGISVEATDDNDGAYADFIAQQSDEEERPRQPAPDLFSCKNCSSLYCGPRTCRFTPAEPRS